MATGIVSNAFFLLGQRTLSAALVVVAVAAYLVLVGLLAARAALYPRLLWSDLVDPEHVFLFFTFVAGTDVLGLALHLRGENGVATGLCLTGLAVWAVLGYFSFSVLTFVNVEEETEI